MIDPSLLARLGRDSGNEIGTYWMGPDEFVDQFLQVTRTSLNYFLSRPLNPGYMVNDSFFLLTQTRHSP